MYKGVGRFIHGPVATLPFEPVKFIRNVSQRGLDNPELTDCAYVRTVFRGMLANVDCCACLQLGQLKSVHTAGLHPGLVSDRSQAQHLHALGSWALKADAEHGQLLSGNGGSSEATMTAPACFIRIKPCCEVWQGVEWHGNGKCVAASIWQRCVSATLQQVTQR